MHRVVQVGCVATVAIETPEKLKAPRAISGHGSAFVTTFAELCGSAGIPVGSFRISQTFRQNYGWSRIGESGEASFVPLVLGPVMRQLLH